MQELRALVSAESSKLTTYVSGESIEINYNNIGLLLEGFLKPVGIQEELIASPAALLPSNVGATQYSVETRARAIIFNVGAIGADRTLHRRPSLLPPTPHTSSFDQLQRSFRKEHRGLMSWPEGIYDAKQQQETNSTALSLSERAMRLSIFGSMVKDYRKSASFGGIRNNKSQDNILYKKLPLNSAQGLVSAKSEGSIVTKKQLETRKLCVSFLCKRKAAQGEIRWKNQAMMKMKMKELL